MALVPLQNPLELLAILPNVMNWRGTWDVTEQYFKNDVVVSPVNQASYILNGQNTSLGGADPTFNPDWIELSLPTTGVASVGAGVGLALDPLSTATNPILDNAGLITLTAGPGMFVDNTNAQNPIVENTGVISVTAGTGMNVDNTNPQAPIVENDGVLSVASIGAGINVDNTDPKNPVVSNTGIVAVTAGTGISVSTTTGNATISSTVAQPLLTTIVVNTAVVPTGANPMSIIPGSNAVGVQLIGSLADTFWTIVRDPTKSGGFLIDLTDFTFTIQSQSPSLVAAAITSSFNGSTSGIPYTFPIISTNGGVINLATANASAGPFTYAANGGQAFLDLATFRLITNAVNVLASYPQDLLFTNQTGVDIFLASYPSVIFMRYYPNGIQ